MATMKSSGGKIGGGKYAGKSPVRSVPKGVTKQAQRTVAPAKGYGQSATGRNATAAERAVNKAGPSGHSNTTSKARQSMDVAPMAKARNTGRTIKQQAQKAAIQSAIEGATSGIAGKFREEANSRPKQQLLREDKKTARVPADTMTAKKKKMY